MKAPVTTTEKPAEYEIVDTRARTDAAGRMGGGKVVTRDGKRFVMLTAAQAKWYLEHGTVRKV